MNSQGRSAERRCLFKQGKPEKLLSRQVSYLSVPHILAPYPPNPPMNLHISSYGPAVFVKGILGQTAVGERLTRSGTPVKKAQKIRKHDEKGRLGSARCRLPLIGPTSCGKWHSYRQLSYLKSSLLKTLIHFPVSFDYEILLFWTPHFVDHVTSTLLLIPCVLCETTSQETRFR